MERADVINAVFGGEITNSPKLSQKPGSRKLKRQPRSFDNQEDSENISSSSTTTEVVKKRPSIGHHSAVVSQRAFDEDETYSDDNKEQVPEIELIPPPLATTTLVRKPSNQLQQRGAIIRSAPIEPQPDLNVSVEYAAAPPRRPVSSAKKPASVKRNDEIEALKLTLVGQSHWTRMRDSLQRICDLIRNDAIDGESLIRLSHALGLHVNNGRSQLALAACACVEVACEVSSRSPRVPVQDFEVFSRLLVAPASNLASSLSTGCKAAQDAGIRCLLNLYLANPKMDLGLVLGQDSIGMSKNVQARRAAANLVFNLISKDKTCSLERDEHLAASVVRFFTDSDPETRFIARRCLKEFISSSMESEWIDAKILSLVKDKVEEDSMMPFLKQFALEYPDSAKLFGLDPPVRPLSLLSASKSSAVKKTVAQTPSDFATPEHEQDEEDRITLTPPRSANFAQRLLLQEEEESFTPIVLEDSAVSVSPIVLIEEPKEENAQDPSSPMGQMLLQKKMFANNRRACSSPLGQGLLERKLSQQRKPLADLIRELDEQEAQVPTAAKTAERTREAVPKLLLLFIIGAWSIAMAGLSLMAMEYDFVEHHQQDLWMMPQTQEEDVSLQQQQIVDEVEEEEEVQLDSSVIGVIVEEEEQQEEGSDEDKQENIIMETIIQAEEDIVETSLLAEELVQDTSAIHQFQGELVEEVPVSRVMQEELMEDTPVIQVIQEEVQKQETSSSSSSSISIPFVLLALVAYVFKPTSSSESAADEETTLEVLGDGEQAKPVAPVRRSKRISPPKGRFSAVEITAADAQGGQAKMRPVVRSRRVAEPDEVSVQEVEGRGNVTLITPRKTRSKA